MPNAISQLSYVGSEMQVPFRARQSAAHVIKLAIRSPPDMQAPVTIGAASTVPGHADHRNRHRILRRAPLIWRWDKGPHPCPSCAADHGRANGGEYHAPGFGWHADLRQPQRRVIASDGRGCGVEQRDQGADNWYADRGKDNLADRQRRAAGKDADD